jgi:hypothetical protein
MKMCKWCKKMLQHYIDTFEKNVSKPIYSVLCCQNQYLGIDDTVKTCLIDFKEHFIKESDHPKVPFDIDFNWWKEHKEKLHVLRRENALYNYQTLIRKRLTNVQIDEIEFNVLKELQSLRDDLSRRNKENEAL